VFKFLFMSLVTLSVYKERDYEYLSNAAGWSAQMIKTLSEKCQNESIHCLMLEA
jgi:hypothetical protein